MEIYIDYVVVKTKQASDYFGDLEEVVKIFKEFGLRLNASKCAFGVGSEKFLDYLVTRRGIEPNSKQIRALQTVERSKTVKEVQRLTGMTAALNRFISRSSNKCKPFF